jgi:hypothetical protein
MGNGEHQLRTHGMVLTGSMQWIAALLDCVENYAQFVLLLGSRQDGYADLARYCSIPKFALAALGIIYVLRGGFAALFGNSKKVR